MEDKVRAYCGHIRRKIFENPANGFAVALFEPLGHLPNLAKQEAFIVTGPLSPLQVDDRVSLEGKWTEHPRYGPQFEVLFYRYESPTSEEGMVSYLSSHLFKGIGPELAKRIVAKFGEKSIWIAENEPESLLKIKGIGRRLIKALTAKAKEAKGLRELLLFLSEFGLPHSLGMKIYKVYGEFSLARLQEDPYDLAEKVNGIGFKTADEIAQSLGIPKHDPIRARAGLKWVLNEALEAGSMCLPRNRLLMEAQKRLNLDSEPLISSLDNLISRGEVVEEPTIEALYLKKAYVLELSLLKRLTKRLEGSPRASLDPPTQALQKAQRQAQVVLSPEQTHIAQSLLSTPLAILTGGPGTGKTTLVSVLARSLEASKERFALCAPTGRAAKRLQEVTNYEASTIHRLLEFQPYLGYFQKNEENPLQLDTLIVDETSMVDAFLFEALLRALPQKTKLILVGDKDQLPPVGPGQVFKDLIRSGMVPTFELKQIFRQAEASTIVLSAHAIRQGKVPDMPRMEPDFKLLGDGKRPDFYFIHEENASRIVESLVELALCSLPSAFPELGSDGFQILTPVHRGPLGTIAINEALQEARLAKGDIKPPFLQVGRQRFFVGDRILQLKNDYQNEVFNGDIGIVIHALPEKRLLTAKFYGRTVEIKGEGLEDIGLAYAISVHKAQGSEFGVVLMPIVTDHFVMLQRNLLYTALTRAKSLAVWIGTKRALRIGVQSSRENRRRTGLADFLQFPPRGLRGHSLKNPMESEPLLT